MYTTLQMEEFSRAYIRAISAQAGYNSYRYNVDDDSIDLGISTKDSARARLEIQLKSTGSITILDSDTFPFDLSVKNYNDLRHDVIVPRLLVIVRVPQDIGAWTNQTEQELCLRHCAYWHSLAGMPDTKNTATVRLHVLRANIFSVDFLKETMRHIAEGKRL